MIKIRQLSKSFDKVNVLNSVELKVNKGEVVTIIGPSGTGKSTLLRCINYLEKPESGIIEISGKRYDFSNISKQEIIELRRFSCMVFQTYNLFRNKTVLENVTEALIVVQKMSREKAKEIALESLETVNMLNKINEYPSRLSGGQQQRVGIARALAVKPEVLLFDEPTSSLDPELVDEVLNVIKKVAFNLNMTMLIVTHEMDFARNISDRIIFMADGYIQEEGEPDQMLSNPKSNRLREFLRISCPTDSE